MGDLLILFLRGRLLDIPCRKNFATITNIDRMPTFMDINMAMRPVNAMFRKGVMFISSDEVIRVRKGSGDINGDEWRPESSCADGCFIIVTS